MSRFCRYSLVLVGLLAVACDEPAPMEGADEIAARWCTQFGPPLGFEAGAEPEWLGEFIQPLEADGLVDEQRLAIVRQKAVHLHDAAWIGRRELRVSFIDRSCQRVRREIERDAPLWTPHTGVPFNFLRRLGREGDIRITCREPGYWSVVGRVGKPPSGSHGATMNLGGLLSERDEDERRGKILHEFGHALGAVHEHQSPLAKIKWNEPKVLEYYWKTYRWSPWIVRSEVFRQYTLDEVQASTLDPKSVMMYPIPPGLTTDNFVVPSNHALSAEDKRFMSTVYQAERSKP